MAPRNSTAELKNLLSQFIGESDSLFETLKWLTEKLMATGGRTESRLKERI